jgi:predicted acylesterase/phospholipase RssA
MMDDYSAKRSNVHRALVFQGGGSLGAYEAGAYKAMSEELSVFLGKLQEGEEKKREPVLFHIVSGTSIGAINAAILVSYVKENRTWQGSGQRLVAFWEYLSTHSNVDSMGAYFTNSWDYWRVLDSRN